MTQTMRLLFVTRSLPFHHMGGMEAVAWDLAQSLSARGHRVDVLTSPCDKLKGVYNVEGVNIRTMQCASGRYSKAYWKQTSDIFKSEYRTDVDLVLGIGMGAYSIARSRSQYICPPILMQSHGQSWGELVSKLAVPSPLSWVKSIKNIAGLPAERTLRRFDRVIAVGPAVADVLLSRPTRWLAGNVPVEIINNGVSETLFAFDETSRQSVRNTLKIPLGSPVLISACRLHIQKGIKESLRGFANARLANRELVYIIAGSGPAEAELRNYVQHLGVSNAVRFTGAIARTDLPKMLSASDVFMFTSKRREGLALGPLEASASGLPCVLSNHLALPGLESILVNPDVVDEVTHGINAALLLTRKERSSLLPKHYSLSSAVSSYETIFREEISKQFM